MTEFLVSSVVASIVITVLLNVTIRAFPGTSADARARQMLGEEQARPDEMPSTLDADRVRIYFPWRQILVWSMAVSVVLTAARMLG